MHTELETKRREFFAVVSELPYTLKPEDAKESIKIFYDVDSFNDLTLRQLTVFIKSLRKKYQIYHHDTRTVQDSRGNTVNAKTGEIIYKKEENGN